MALGTITINSHNANGDVRTLNLTFNGDGDYPTGGTVDFTDLLNAAVKTAAGVASDHNVRGAETLEILGLLEDNTTTYRAVYDKANDTLLMYDETMTEVVAHTDLHTTSVSISLLCK
jgi:hypothetical protein